MPTLIFVFGTLKEGFPNFPTNRGRRVPGRFRTEMAFPLYLVGDRHAPWMLDSPNSGLNVTGEVYEVDEDALRLMDVLERVHEPDGYIRKLILVKRDETPDNHPRLCTPISRHRPCSDRKMSALAPYSSTHSSMPRFIGPERPNSSVNGRPTVGTALPRTLGTK